MNLGRLEKVDLRDQWKEEARDFTPWLAKPENLQLLGDALEIDIELESTEVNVGTFKADMLASDTRGRKIIIENQLNKTDHDHLGKIITYASGTNAAIVVWISREITEEHRRAIDWLNEIAGEDVGFFALEVELWRIGESIRAPKFNIVCKPNEWAQTVKDQTDPSHTETQVRRYEFWTGLREYMLSKKTELKPRGPTFEHWYDLAIGRSGFHISLTIGTQKKTLGCELYVDGDSAKEAFRQLLASRAEIEKGIGETLDWQELPNKQACRIIRVTEADVTRKESWPEYFEWFRNQAELFYKTFSPRIRQLELHD